MGHPAVLFFADMIVGDLFVPGTREWDTEVILEVFTLEDSACILRTTPAPFGVANKRIWHYSPNGEYLVKKAYHLAIKIVDDTWVHGESPWRVFWRIKVPPKVRLFYWRLCKGCLAVTFKLRSWYPTIDAMCPLCNQMPEKL